jgi:hypothetical protein
VAQRVVVVNVLVAQRDRGDPLSDQRLYAMHRAVRIASVDEARGHPAEQADGFINVAQKQGASIRSDRSAVETGDHFVAVKAFKFELIAATVCLHRTPFLNLITLCCKSSFSDSRGRCTPYFEIFRPGVISQEGSGLSTHCATQHQVADTSACRRMITIIPNRLAGTAPLPKSGS